MINCTETAIAELLRLKKNLDFDHEVAQRDRVYVRLKIEKGGCQDYVYQLNFDGEISEDDEKISPITDITIVIDRTSYQYLKDIKIDYTEDLMGGAFQFKNPNIKEHCTCGLSFKLD